MSDKNFAILTQIFHVFWHKSVRRTMKLAKVKENMFCFSEAI